MKKFHFIGIGGIGMSGLADIFLARGSRITGSDLRGNNLTKELASKGVRVSEGHTPENVDEDTDIVVRSISHG